MRKLQKFFNKTETKTNLQEKIIQSTQKYPTPPNEIISHILSYLDGKSLVNLREVSKFGKWFIDGTHNFNDLNLLIEYFGNNKNVIVNLISTFTADRALELIYLCRKTDAWKDLNDKGSYNQFTPIDVIYFALVTPHLEKQLIQQLRKTLQTNASLVNKEMLENLQIMCILPSFVASEYRYDFYKAFKDRMKTRSMNKNKKYLNFGAQIGLKCNNMDLSGVNLQHCMVELNDAYVAEAFLKKTFIINFDKPFISISDNDIKNNRLTKKLDDLYETYLHRKNSEFKFFYDPTEEEKDNYFFGLRLPETKEKFLLNIENNIIRILEENPTLKNNPRLALKVVEEALAHPLFQASLLKLSTDEVKAKRKNIISTFWNNHMTCCARLVIKKNQLENIVAKMGPAIEKQNLSFKQ